LAGWPWYGISVKSMAIRWPRLPLENRFGKRSPNAALIRASSSVCGGSVDNSACRSVSSEGTPANRSHASCSDFIRAAANNKTARMIPAEHLVE
jgi:hypothetical protein